jgi:predicted ArsR family transcriptional regulator
MSRLTPNWIQRLGSETQVKLIALLRRSRQTITGMAESLGLTDNAIRTHVTILSRDGIIHDAGVERDTGGKPARIYGLTPEGEELFPKAYPLVLERLIAEITRREGREKTVRLLKAVGAAAAAESNVSVPADLKGRAQAAANVLRELGGEVDVQRVDGAWRLQGVGCPLSALTADHAEVCQLVRSVVEKVTGEKVTECCDRGALPRCRFEIAG